VNNFHIGNTENSTTWVSNQTENVQFLHLNGGTAEIGGFSWGTYVYSAGYVSIRVSSNNNSTYVGLEYQVGLEKLTYYQVSVGFGGTLVFPVLPMSLLGVSVGSYGNATLTITITYYY
jgi:hypothetical protein